MLNVPALQPTPVQIEGIRLIKSIFRTRFLLERPKKLFQLLNAWSEEETNSPVRTAENSRHRRIPLAIYSIGFRLNELFNPRKLDWLNGRYTLRSVKRLEHFVSLLSTLSIEILAARTRQRPVQYLQRAELPSGSGRKAGLEALLHTLKF